MAVLMVNLTACMDMMGTDQEHKSEHVNRSTSLTKNQTNHTSPTHWSYSGETKPEKWGDLDPQYKMCTNGKEQSPIDIEFSQVKHDSHLSKIKMDYQSTVFSLENNGHTIQANSHYSHNSITIDDVKYQFTQFHFHTPSEHQFNGKNLDMELHLVHKNAKGQIAVLGMLIKEGQENTRFSPIWDHLPQKETKDKIKIQDPLNLSEILPKDQKAFRYTGSLTTPPCTQNVKWVILEQPIEMSKEQIEKFVRIFPDDHRPVKELNGRVIVEN